MANWHVQICASASLSKKILQKFHCSGFQKNTMTLNYNVNVVHVNES